MTKGEQLAISVEKACKYVLSTRSEGMKSTRRVVCTDEEKAMIEEASRMYGIKQETIHEILFNRDGS